jgi:hypothetical protein
VPTTDPSCISAQVWTAHTTDANKLTESVNGCWQLSDWGITFYIDKFSFFDSGFHRAEWYGVSHHITSNNSTIEFTLTITNMENAEIWMGLTQDIDPSKNGVFLVRQADGLFDLRSLGENGNVWTISNDNQIASENQTYSVKFELQGARMHVHVNNLIWTYGDIPIPFPAPRLYLGYRGLLNGIVYARITFPQVTENTPR